MIKMLCPFILASASPRRRELLEGAGISFEVVSAPPEEEDRVEPSLLPRDFTMRRALAKASWAASRRPEAAVLGADTVVVLEGEVFGKPSDAATAHQMLSRLSGRTHQVLTGFAVVTSKSGRTQVVETDVSFRTLDGDLVERYVDSGEPMDKAGSYAIQGAGAYLVNRVMGSYTNVIGLPLPEVLVVLADCGVLEWHSG